MTRWCLKLFSLDLEENMMSQPILTTPTYLQQQREKPKWVDEEAEAMLACLPKRTPVFHYQSMPKMEAAAHTVNDSWYCVFVEVPERICDDKREKVKIGRIQHYPKAKIIIAKMPGKSHEIAAHLVAVSIYDQMRDCRMRLWGNLKETGSVLLDGKEPDVSLQPTLLPPGRSEIWPTLVVEAGRSESHAALERDAHWWRCHPNGAVGVVITIKVSKTKITIKRYDPAGLQDDILIKRGRRQNATVTVTGGPLTIPFADLFLRQPVGAQSDFVLDAAELEEWAREIWLEF
ncbi:hypothetical protein FQN57_001747 [Myotisia sp. PD_48]|nr:hypothetical protein FQN57_001747 [Myotisia sp. PD_48]